MLDTEQLVAAKKLCELLLWQNLEEVESSFSTLKDYLNDDYDINTAFRMSVPTLYSVDWNELDILLDYLTRKVATLQIPLNLAEVVDEGITSEIEEFFPKVSKALAEHGFDLWSLETGMAMYCICVAPEGLREEIADAKTAIRLDLWLDE